MQFSRISCGIFCKRKTLKNPDLGQGLLKAFHFSGGPKNDQPRDYAYFTCEAIDSEKENERFHMGNNLDGFYAFS